MYGAYVVGDIVKKGREFNIVAGLQSESNKGRQNKEKNLRGKELRRLGRGCIPDNCLVPLLSSLDGRHKPGKVGGGGGGKGEWKKGKKRAIHIYARRFPGYEINEIEIGMPFLRIADFMREFTMFTAQHELADWNFVAARGKGLSLLQASFPSISSSPLSVAATQANFCNNLFF